MAPRPPFSPQAVLFDLDGLLVDSEGRWEEAERQVVRDLGHLWDPSIQALLFGKGPDDAAAALSERLGGPDRREVARRLLVAAVRAFRRGVPLRPGADSLVAALRGRMPLGVVTNSQRVLADIALSSSGVAGDFDVVVCAEDSPAPKPDPAPYALACDRLGVDPGATVALEDSPVGMRSARAAGLWVIGCPSLAGQPRGSAHVIVGSLQEIDPRALVRAA